MDANGSVWQRYQPGYVDPEFVPYLRSIINDPYGNKVSINTWEKQGCPQLVSEDLVRKNWGLRFQRQFDTDPCPLGWISGPDGYCFREPLKNERVFYTDKAFIAKRQHWDGYTKQLDRDISQSTDMRSVNPLTGKYTVYYRSVDSKADTRYAKPIVPDRIQYDNSWYLQPRSRYGELSTRDSYL